MIGFRLKLTVALGAILATALAPNALAQSDTDYIERGVEGWTLHIRTDLWREHRAATEKALTLLQKQLAEIVANVPSSAVATLRRIPLWFSPAYAGIPPRAEYHPGAGWLREHGRNPSMVKGVEFTNIPEFEKEAIRMPNFALHELAHAYHDRFLPDGFENAEIIAAYRRAIENHCYEKVERHNGQGRTNTFERAYALTSPQEFFAECSEAFFSRNDFFPFDRRDLESHDPETYQLLAHLWNCNAAEPRPKNVSPGKSGE